MLIVKRQRIIEKERGYIMNFANELYVTLSRRNDGKEIRNSSVSIERDNWVSIYENIEKIINGKKTASLDLDIQILLRSLV
ncbi:hypothetical protein [Lutispora thermophila]|uniref:Uncharacterized protein n=1 Tax=Lutispora thermophila DSM 19022 TaxID=1122184 RepID=A0A1M6B9I9_9FIRM|nr:hypothetical protein [Lutispora thermophila]SHI45133.1 hypothetical protein SAMN02745176_00334 [Lutispora thermophila DSM 19022]